MQYLNLVYLAERKGEAAGRKYLPARGPCMPAADVRRDERGALQDDDGPFFTDGPYIETKEYTGAGRDG